MESERQADPDAVAPSDAAADVSKELRRILK
jgi:hypothetical protein